jgi:hypothetical protein
MSDERSVEARLLRGLLGLSLNSNLVDPNTDSSHYTEAEIPQHITSNLRNTADRSPSFELCHLARLGLSISSRVWRTDFFFESLVLTQADASGQFFLLFPGTGVMHHCS